MTNSEVVQQYNSYLDCLSGIPNPHYSLKYAYYKGLIHGLGVALGYDYEAVEQDIRRAAVPEPMPGQIRLVM